MADSEVRQKFEATELLESAWASYEDRLDGPEAAWKAFRFAFSAGMRAGEIARWIPVEEKLPDEHEMVLVAVAVEADDHDGLTQHWREVHEARIYRGCSKVVASTADNGEYIDGEILGWQPLPAAPEEKKCETK